MQEAGEQIREALGHLRQAADRIGVLPSDDRQATNYGLLRIAAKLLSLVLERVRRGEE